MESYCAIIEGLVSMMIATGALPSQVTSVGMRTLTLTPK